MKFLPPHKLICNHPIRLGNLCTQCGETISESAEDLFCLLHNNDTLKTTKNEAKRISKQKKKKLDKDKKLVLIVDLDQTILHASYNSQLKYCNFEEIKVKKNKKRTVEITSRDKLFVPEITKNIEGAWHNSIRTANKNKTELLVDNNIANNINGNAQKELTQQKVVRETIGGSNNLHFNSSVKDKSNDVCDIFHNDSPDDHVKISIEGSKGTKSVNRTHDEDLEPSDTVETCPNKNEPFTCESPRKKAKSNFPFTLYTFRICKIKYYIKLRPHLDDLLAYCQERYEMHIYTMGNREYANYILKIIDPEGKFFGDRIITRDENEKLLEKNLDRLSREHRNIVILDDRGDVWKYVPNLINVKPYFFFRSGDINAPERIGKSLVEVYQASKDNKNIFYDNNDAHLLYVKGLLEKIYDMYFSATKNVKRVLQKLRKSIFEGKRFYLDKNIKINRSQIKKIIKLCNGTCKKKDIDLIIAMNLNETILDKQTTYKTDIVSLEWIMECYSLTRNIAFDKYILKRYNENEFADELEEMLESDM